MIDLHLTELRADSIGFRMRQHIGQNLKKYADQTLLDSILAFAAAAGLSDKYRQHLKFVQISWIECYYELDWKGPKGEPLGLWFEYGTKPHTIRAVRALFLYFFWNKLNKYVRFKSVRHPGTKGLYIMTRGEKFGLPRLADRIISEINQFVLDNRMQ